MQNPRKLSAPAFHSINSVADRLGVSRRTVARWIKNGDLNAHKFGRSVRVSEDHLQQMITRGRRLAERDE